MYPLPMLEDVAMGNGGGGVCNSKVATVNHLLWPRYPLGLGTLRSNQESELTEPANYS